MPSLPSAKSMTTRKRTRSTNVTESNVDHQQVVSTGAAGAATTTVTSNSIPTTTVLSATMPALPTNTNTLNAPPKRQRNNPPTTGQPPPVAPRTHYSLRNRSLTPDPRRPLIRFPSVSSTSTARQRYNLRTRRPESQIRLPQVPNPHPTVAPRRFRRPIPPITRTTPISLSSTNITQSVSIPIPPPIFSSSTIPVPSPIPPLILPTPPAIQPRQIRFVYIPDEDDDQPITTPSTDNNIVGSVLNFRAVDDNDLSARSTSGFGRTSRSTIGAGLNTRSRTMTATPSSASSSSSSSSSSSTSTINTQDFISGVAHIRLNRAIEIVIDSIQSLEGTVNNFDQLVFGLIYGRLGSRTEFDSIESMIRLSRILSLNLPPPRLTQEEIDSLPKIIFVNKTVSTVSMHLAEKCPICLTEFNDQETINKLHCTHLFHLQCISTWLSENDSCPTCRRKAIGD